MTTSTGQHSTGDKMKFKSLTKLAAEELIFSNFVPEDERKIVEKGWDSFKWGFFKKNRAEAIRRLKEEDNIGLYRVLMDTTMYLKHVGDDRHLHMIKSWEQFWREHGEIAIADALKVRIAEAEYQKPEVINEGPESLQESDYSFIGDDDEEAPMTMRSVAKAIRFATIYYKLARG